MTDKIQKLCEAAGLDPARKYFNLSESAAIMEVSPSTMARWLSDRRIPHERLGPQTVRVGIEDLEAFLAAARVEAAS
jgi:excisionase family DNA binding protein